uniref:Uncharacterized protein n=1 Tax=Arundo donax TaxID=35708 RepID=A0A0A9BA19_ARUDO
MSLLVCPAPPFLVYNTVVCSGREDGQQALRWHCGILCWRAAQERGKRWRK